MIQPLFTMGRAGLQLVVISFLGIPAFFVLGFSRSMSLAILTHAAFITLIAIIARLRCGSFRSVWLGLDPSKAQYYPHPSAAVLAGFIFVAGGVMVFLAEPGSEVNSMNIGGQIYFGSIFVGIGGGISLTAGDAWRKLARKKKRNPFVSEDQ